MTRFEAKIRDYLAQNLNLIDPNLQLIKKEFELPNSHGAGGFIDILAKDTMGHLVAIEIKRSDQTARAALHELTKYVALLKASKGLRSESIRALLVSTEWHELAVPFSEYLKVCEVPTEGIHITADIDGTVTSAKNFIPVELDAPLEISHVQDLILFKSAAQRQAQLERVIDAVKTSAIENFAILFLDYEGGDRKIIHPFGIYLIFSSPLLGLSESGVKALKKKLKWDKDLDQPDENFLVAFRNTLGPIGDENGIGYPEKLKKINADGWRISVAFRGGRYSANDQVLPDTQLIAEAMKNEGGASYYLNRTASPRYALSWEKLKKSINIVLLGNKNWASIFSGLLKEIEQRNRSATVSLYVYHPANIVLGLGHFFAEDDEGYLPCFQMIVSHGENTTLYLGLLGWSGKLISFDGNEWMKKAYGSLDGFMVKQHFGEQFQRDDYARELIGIASLVFEIQNPGKASEQIFVLSKNSGRLVRTKRSACTYQTLYDFHDKQQHFADTLVRVLASIGLLNAGSRINK